MKRRIKMNWLSWLLAGLSILLVAGFAFTRWQNASGSLQAQSAVPANPDQQFIDGLQQMLAKNDLSLEDRANLQKKLEMMQRLESQRQASPRSGSKPTGPNVPPVKAPQSLIAPPPQEGIFDGSGALVHDWQANIINMWQKTLGNQSYQVLAGSLPDDATQGLLIVMVSQNKVLGREEQTYLTPTKSGALHITTVSGAMLSLLDANGGAWTFDLTSRAFQKQ